MTPKALLLVALSLVFSLPSFAFEISKDDYECSLTAGKDPYETPTRIGKGSQLYADQCIDTDRFRPPVILKNTKDEISFANYRHANKYWKATIKKNAVIDKVFFQIVRFDVVSGVTAAHTQFRVRFAKDSEMKIVDQDPKDPSPFSTYVSDLVVSFEASRPKGEDYNFALGAVDNYLAVARVLSGRQRLLEGRTNKTEQYEIAIPKDERMLMVVSALEQGNREKFNRFYNTLRPNCTTDVFDLIDSLPSQVGRSNEPFLTIISNDPVAGPSLQALTERGLNPQWTSYLSSEVVMGNEKDIKQDTSGMELNLLSSIEDYPYSAVIATEEGKNSDEVVNKAKAIAYNLAPQLAQRLGSSVMLSGQEASFSLLSSLKDLAPTVQQQLKAINGELSDQPTNVSIYLTPWNQTGRRVDVLQELGVKARLPVDTFETTYKKAKKMDVGLRKVTVDKSREGGHFGLMAVAIHLNLVKDQSTASLQVLGHLGPQKQIFEKPIETDAANVVGVVVPKHSPYEHLLQPTVLLDLTVEYDNEIPLFNMQFGPYSGYYTNQGDHRVRGKFTVDPQSCHWQAHSSPYLKAKVGPGKWVPARMQISRIDFDLEKRQASDMEVDVKALAVVCLNKHKDASEKVKDAVNEQLIELEDKAQKQGTTLGIQLLESFLSNNPDPDKVAGVEIN